MPLPVSIPNTFANATSSIPLSQLDTNFSTLANAVNDINSGATTLANLKSSNVTITGGVISNVTLDNVTVDVETLSNVTINGGNVTVTNMVATTANATTGNITTIVAGAGTSAAPSITTTGDTNTGIFFPAADTIAFTEGGAEAMRIDSSGNVGIAYTTPSSMNSAARNLVVGGGSGNTGLTIFSGTASYSSIHFADGTTTTDAYRGFIWYSHSDDALGFGTGATERLRIDSSGNVGINCTPSNATLHLIAVTGSNANIPTIKVEAAVYPMIDFIVQNTNSSARNWRLASVYNDYGRFEIISGTTQGGNPTTTVLGLKQGSSVALEGATPQSGTGITFPATPNNSNNANTLDEYEEGTFTPTDTSGAGLSFVAGTSARYVKIGKRVFCDLELLFPSTASGAGISIGSLPFTSADDGNYSSGTCMNDANVSLTSFVGVNTTNITIYEVSTNFTTASNADVSQKGLYITISYNAAN
jgi:hypothetical protein